MTHKRSQAYLSPSPNSMTVLTATAGVQSTAWERLRDVSMLSQGSSHPLGTASPCPSATRMRLTKYSAFRRFLLFGLKRFLATSLSLSHTTPSRVRMLSASMYFPRSSHLYLLSLNLQSSSRALHQCRCSLLVPGTAEAPAYVPVWMRS